MSPDGSDVRQLTDDNESSSRPSWSPDGSRIAFISTRGGRTTGTWGIHTMKSDGSDVKYLPLPRSGDLHSPLRVSWSPDGSRIAFNSNEILIATISSEGSDIRQLQSGDFSGERYIGASWSPDGTRVAFSIGNIIDNGRFRAFQIYTISSDGSDARQLTNSQSGTDNWLSSSAWSPDGSRIAFYSNRDGDFEIYTMKSDGSDVRQLTVNESKDMDPSYSPDGSRIVFTSNRDGDDLEIYTMSSAGSDVRQLTDNEYRDAAPVWSP